jgi:Lrp/AsnC family leucine-responsive transcriptional regulator
MPRRAKPYFKPDLIDLRLIEVLQENARTPFAQIGRLVGLSQPATSERIRRLEDVGVITGYGARIDPAALGLVLRVSIRIKVALGCLPRCLEHLRSMPEVIEVHRLTGEDCVEARLVVPDAADLARIIDDVARFGEVRTSVIVSSDPPRAIGRDMLLATGPSTRRLQTNVSGGAG